jgi:hypothetical protein
MGNAASIFDCAVNPLNPLPSEEAEDEALAPPEPSVIQDAVPLRDSALWRLQTSFYERAGERAWTDGIVPNFVTSNSFIARAYARVIIGVMRDAAFATSPSSPHLTEPLHILEVGGGHGKLAYLVVAYLLQFRSFLPKVRRPAASSAAEEQGEGDSDAAPFKYILRDSSSTAMAAALHHPSLSTWIKEGLLVVAVWDELSG